MGHRVEDRQGRVRSREILREHEDRNAVVAGELGGQGLQAFSAPRNEDERMALRGELPSELDPNAARGSGDQRVGDGAPVMLEEPTVRLRAGGSSGLIGSAIL